jgi:hypothetical protein
MLLTFFFLFLASFKSRVSLHLSGSLSPGITWEYYRLFGDGVKAFYHFSQSFRYMVFDVVLLLRDGQDDVESWANRLRLCQS